MKKYICFYIIVILLASLKLSFAQIDTTENNSKEIRKIVKQKLMEKLNVDEKTLNAYLVIYRDYRKKINDLNKQKESLTNYIEDNSDDEDISQKMDALLDTLDKITDTRREFINNAKKILTPQQIAKAIVFQKKLRKMMQK